VKGLRRGRGVRVKVAWPPSGTAASCACGAPGTHGCFPRAPSLTLQTAEGSGFWTPSMLARGKGKRVVLAHERAQRAAHWLAVRAEVCAVNRMLVHPLFCCKMVESPTGRSRRHQSSPEGEKERAEGQSAGRGGINESSASELQTSSIPTGTPSLHAVKNRTVACCKRLLLAPERSQILQGGDPTPGG